MADNLPALGNQRHIFITVTVDVNEFPPAAITDLTASSGADEGSVTLQWTAPGDDGFSGTAQGYELKIATYQITTALYNGASTYAPASSWMPLAGGLLEGAGGSRVVAGLEPGATYFFALKAFDDYPFYSHWESPLDIATSNVSNFAVALDLPPAPPTSVTATPGNGQATITWSASTATDVAGYILEEDSSVPADVFTAVAFTTGTSFVRTGLTNGNTYYYRVIAVDRGLPAYPGQALSGEPSSVVSVVPVSVGPPNPPTGLSITGVTDQSVSLAWSANGNPAFVSYQLQRAPFASGPWSVIFTTSGTQFTDATAGESTTFYYRIRAFNSEGFSAFEGPVSTVTLTIAPGPLPSFNATANTAVGKQIVLAWSNPPDPDLAGILIIRATQPVVFTPQQYVAYSVGQSVGNGVVVYNAIAAPLAFTDTGLSALTTYYYLAFARDEVPNYGAASSAFAFSVPPIDTVAPSEVAGFTAVRSPDGTQITLRWSPVISNADAARSAIEDLVSYRVIRSTALGAVENVRANLDPSFHSYTDTLDLVTTYYYKIRAIDFSNNASQDSAIIESVAAPKTFIIRGPSLVSLKGESAAKMLAANNPSGVDIVFKTQENNQEKNNIIMQSVVITAQNAATGAPVKGLSFKPDEFEIIFSFESSTFPISAFGAQQALGAQAAPGIKLKSPATVAVYWHNGVEWVNLHGEVNDTLKTISVKQPNIGAFQVRRHVQGLGFNMDSAGVRPKIITPNGDGKNDAVIFYFDNPNNVEVKGKIFDVNGAFVADVKQAGPIPGITLKWDGRDFNGNVVPLGIYIYRLQAEGRSFTGTVVVAR